MLRRVCVSCPQRSFVVTAALRGVKRPLHSHLPQKEPPVVPAATRWLHTIQRCPTLQVGSSHVSEAAVILVTRPGSASRSQGHGPALPSPQLHLSQDSFPLSGRASQYASSGTRPLILPTISDGRRSQYFRLQRPRGN